MISKDESSKTESERSEVAKVDEVMAKFGIKNFSEIVYRHVPKKILEKIKKSDKPLVCEAIAVPTANIRMLTTVVTCLVKDLMYLALSFTDDSPEANEIKAPHKGALRFNPDGTASNIVSRNQLDGKPRLADVVTVGGLSLPEYHNKLLREWLGDLAPIGFDLSGIFKEATIEFLLNYDVSTNLVDLSSIYLFCHSSFVSVFESSDVRPLRKNGGTCVITAEQMIKWISDQRKKELNEADIKEQLNQLVIRMDGASYYGTVPLYPAVLSCLGLNLLEYFTPGEGQSIFGPLWSKGLRTLGIGNISHIQQPLYEPVDKDNWGDNPLLSHKYIPEKLRDPNEIRKFADRFIKYLESEGVKIVEESFESICEYCYRFLVIEFYGDLEV